MTVTVTVIVPVQGLTSYSDAMVSTFLHGAHRKPAVHGHGHGHGIYKGVRCLIVYSDAKFHCTQSLSLVHSTGLNLVCAAKKIDSAEAGGTKLTNDILHGLLLGAGFEGHAGKLVL